MKQFIRIIGFILIMTGNSMAQSFYNFSINDIDGNTIDLKQFEGRPILLVNTASRCGFTKQYANLSNLHQMYLDKNLVIISTPSNSFRQELSEEEDVKEFCLVNYQTKFLLTEIIDVKGANAHPLYKWISDDYGKSPKWNFNKFLFDDQGQLIEYWSSITKPDSKKITSLIDQLI